MDGITFNNQQVNLLPLMEKAIEKMLHITALLDRMHANYKVFKQQVEESFVVWEDQAAEKGATDSTKEIQNSVLQMANESIDEDEFVEEGKKTEDKVEKLIGSIAQKNVTQNQPPIHSHTAKAPLPHHHHLSQPFTFVIFSYQHSVSVAMHTLNGIVFDFEKETNLRGEKFLAHFLFDVLPLKIIFRPFDRGRKKIMEEAPSHSLLKTDSELNAQLMPRGSDPTSLNSIYMNPADVFSDVVGSPYYIAPEILCTHYSPEADVWSAGVILYILVSGVPPFWAETKKEIFEEVLHGDLNFSSDPWPNISQSAEDLVRKMLVRDPRKWITAHEVLCLPWIQVDGVAPDKSLDSAVLSRLKQVFAINKLKKKTLRVIAHHLFEE